MTNDRRSFILFLENDVRYMCGVRVVTSGTSYIIGHSWLDRRLNERGLGTNERLTLCYMASATTICAPLSPVYTCEGGYARRCWRLNLNTPDATVGVSCGEKAYSRNKARNVTKPRLQGRLLRTKAQIILYQTPVLNTDLLLFITYFQPGACIRYILWLPLVRQKKGLA